jgi:hypothetical protein
MNARGLAALTLVVWVAWLPACGDSSSTSSDNACNGASFVICDIRVAGCQTATFQAVACLRGVATGAVPPIRTISADDYAAELRAAGNGTAPNPHLLEAQRLLNFDPGQTDTTSVDEQIATQVRLYVAFYSSSTKGVTIIDHGDMPNMQDTQVTLAHEFVHAQQDREINLGGYVQAKVATDDDFLGVKALIEGEAILYQNLFYLRQLGHDPKTAHWSDYWMSLQAEVDASLTNSSIIIDQADRLFPYAYGGPWMLARWQAGGPSAVRATFNEDRAGTVDFIAGMPIGRAIEMPPAVPSASVPAGNKLAFDDRMGAFDVWGYLTRNRLLTTYDPTDWEGDRLQIYASGADTVVYLRLRFANPDTAAAVDGAVRGRADPSLRSKLAADEVALLMSHSTDALAPWLSALAFP